MLPIIWIIAAVIGVAIVVGVVRWWIVIFNKFIYWKTRAERKFADVDVIMEQLVNMTNDLKDTVKKYDIHEYKTIQNTIEARSKWKKDADINEKIKAAQEVENNFVKIQAVFEKYPKLKADALHIYAARSSKQVYYNLQHVKRGYNRIAQEYNQRVKQFPRSIVARYSGFAPIDYYETEQTKFKAVKEFGPKTGYDED
jgi:LemA protein